MTIEERFEKLTERHEALTQTIELMAHESREQRAEWTEKFSGLERLVRQMAQSVDTLASVVEPHEHRLDHLEGPAA